MDYEYAPLRIPSNTDRATAAAQLTIAAEYSGWELARVRLLRATRVDVTAAITPPPPRSPAFTPHPGAPPRRQADKRM